MKTRKEMDAKAKNLLDELKYGITQHTPTPWKEEDIAGMLWHEVTDADFAFIIRAVNSHEELIKAAYRGIAALEANGAPNCEAVKELKQAIAKAEGE